MSYQSGNSSRHAVICLAAVDQSMLRSSNRLIGSCSVRADHCDNDIGVVTSHLPVPCQLPAKKILRLGLKNHNANHTMGTRTKC